MHDQKVQKYTMTSLNTQLGTFSLWRWKYGNKDKYSLIYWLHG